MNVARYWLLPRLPAWFRRWSLAPIGAFALIGIPFLFGAETWNVLDWKGPEFLQFYVPIAIAAGIFALLARFVVLSGGATTTSTESLTPDEAAYLAAGPQGALGTAVGSLVRTEQIDFQSGGGIGPTLVLAKPKNEPLTPLQQRVLTAVKATGSATLSEVRSTVIPETDLIRARLEQLGLVFGDLQINIARLLASGVVGFVMLLGVFKLAIGISRGKPVLILVAILVPLAIALYFAARRAFRTSAGDQALDKLRKDYEPLEAQVTQQTAAIPTQDMGFALGLFGLGMMAAGPGSELIHYFNSPVRRPNGSWESSAGSYSSCSTSGCSSGSSCGGGSSCGSSSCGGGGCGGCGGGGD